MSEDWKQIESKYYMNVVRRQPMVLEKGYGTKIWDTEGNEYLDFTSGWAVNNLGHCHPAVTAAIKEQAETLLQTSNQFYTIPQLKLAQTLVDNSCFDRVFFCNSGAEANEGATKLARKWGKIHKKGAYHIITALNSFHGRTMNMVAATGQPHYQENWKPLPPGFVNVPFNDINAIKEATTEETCAVMLEPVQGEAGVIIPSSTYLKEVREWCTQQSMLLIVDEVQTGLGRLGTLWGYEKFDIQPDVMTLAKALGNGAPIGAFLARNEAAVLEPGDHGSTFGGNALTCAAAFASTSHIIEKRISAQAETMGQYLQKELKAIDPDGLVIEEIRGMGLLIGVVFKNEIAAQLVESCNQQGLLIHPTRPNLVRLMPPLTVTKQEIDLAISILQNNLPK
ncbi:MAG: aspartate aminotransferase family protein [Dehalococcoidia bacterium]|nr:aspartate aminotransferase family protein [Dehalococcoidia bacterium]